MVCAQGVRLRVALAGAALLVALPGVLRGQGIFNLELRGGGHLPTGEARTAGVPPGGEQDWGASFGVAFSLQQGERNYIGIGFSQHRAACSPGCPRRVTTQWELGFRRDLTGGAVVPWIRGSVVVPRVEGVATPAGDRASRTGYGFEAGGGVRVQLRGRVHLAPGVRIGWGRAPVPGLDDDLPLGWTVGDLGLVVTF